MTSFSGILIFSLLFGSLHQTVSAQAIESIPLGMQEVENTTLEEHGKTYFGAEKGSIKSWQVLMWDDEKLSCSPFQGFRKKSLPFNWDRQDAKNFLIEPIVPESALFVLKGLGTTSFQKTSSFCKSGTTIKETIREDWKKTVSLDAKKLELRAVYQKSADAKILPGSMQLLMSVPGKPDSIILDRAPGMIFSEQKLLWYGDINGDGLPDFLIQRTLITGETDYIISISNTNWQYTVLGITIDSDKPDMGFSSGVGEADYQESQVLNSPKPYPVYTLPQATVTASGQEKTRKMAKSGAMTVSNLLLVSDPASENANTNSNEAPNISLEPAKAEIKRDLVFSFEEEKYRLLVEVLPTFCGEVGGPTYISQLYFGAYGGCPRSLVINLYHKGRRQVLLVTNTIMDGPISVTAGDLDDSGILSISMSWQPHYNNGMYNQWKKTNDGTKIMKRVSVFQSQGC
ncbi:hypothetical protein [Undibacterium sp. Tian12W]|uniref:hypothetical protein n=1 Tax=Undibacterium sp. Tian12W TaxID=3413054 RepID=UPI003BF01FF6